MIPVDDILIRPVRVEDAEDIHHISLQQGVIETTMALPSRRLADERRRLESLSTRDHLFVAEIAERVVGVAGLIVGRGRARHSGYVFIFVARDYQGKGIGTRLMETIIDLADNWLKLKRLELTVLVRNEVAKSFYERYGFKVEGVKRCAVISLGEYEDEYYMGRVI